MPLPNTPFTSLHVVTSASTQQTFHVARCGDVSKCGCSVHHGSNLCPESSSDRQYNEVAQVLIFDIVRLKEMRGEQFNVAHKNVLHGSMPRGKLGRGSSQSAQYSAGSIQSLPLAQQLTNVRGIWKTKCKTITAPTSACAARKIPHAFRFNEGIVDSADRLKLQLLLRT
eukprot:6463890-Amphidinium_carterae.3